MNTNVSESSRSSEDVSSTDANQTLANESPPVAFSEPQSEPSPMKSTALDGSTPQPNDEVPTDDSLTNTATPPPEDTLNAQEKTTF